MSLFHHVQTSIADLTRTIYAKWMMHDMQVGSEAMAAQSRNCEPCHLCNCGCGQGKIAHFAWAFEAGGVSDSQ
eukprot:4534620-Amphidinium_carterae.1